MEINKDIMEAVAWNKVGSVEDFPIDGGMAVKCGSDQIAVFHFEQGDEWYATQNLCPHKMEMVLARGMIGDLNGEPKVACPFHKKNFSLKSGACLSGDDYQLKTYPVKVENGQVLVGLD